MKINKIIEPELNPKKLPMSAMERFIWWKKTYFMTYGVLISLIIVPIFAYRRGNIILGIRMSIIFYACLMIIFYLANRITKKKDIEFLKKEGIPTDIPLKWWVKVLKVFFFLLRIYIIYLLIMTWRMTNG